MRNQAKHIAPPGATSNTQVVLTELAERAARHYCRSTESWLACATVLLEARKIANHGEWLPFLRHAGIPERTARDMLTIVRSGAKSATVADLGIRRTLELIRESRRYTAVAVAYAKADPHRMPHQRTADEIAADEWELAGAFASVVADMERDQ